MDILKNGSITSPRGYLATGVACGIKKNGARDLALIKSETLAETACVFTKNVVKGHSLQLSIEHVKNGKISAFAINSGNANACLGDEGTKNAQVFADSVGEALRIPSEDVLVASTGVIGMPLDMTAIKAGVSEAAGKLTSDGGTIAMEAIMTTDTKKKEMAVSFVDTAGVTITVAGMCKGSGMIHPNMATMIGILTTDATVDSTDLHEVLVTAVEHTFNRTSVDGDTSVCDTVTLMANSCSGAAKLQKGSEDFNKFEKAVTMISEYLARNIAKDGEGASKLIEVKALNASCADNAYKAVLAIAKSPLVKTAIFGEDANWGRIITAAGYSGAEFDPLKVDVYIGSVLTCKNGIAVAFDEAVALKELQNDEITLTVDFNEGTYCDRMFTCDFTYDYVKINGDYRT